MHSFEECKNKLCLGRIVGKEKHQGQFITRSKKGGSVVTNIHEYIDAIEKPSTWMSFTDVEMISECFKIKVIILEIRGGQTFVGSKITPICYGHEFDNGAVIRFVNGDH